MVCTLIDHRNDVKTFQIQVQPSRRRLVSLQSFEHFDVISTVDKSTERGKVLSICFFTIILTVLTSTSFEVSQKIATVGMREL